MIRLSYGQGDMSESYLRRICQLGVDCVNLGVVPAAEGRLSPDLQEVVKTRRTIRSWGLDTNGAQLPDITTSFMGGEEGSDSELERAAEYVKAYAEAGIHLVFVRFQGNNFNHLLTFYDSVHRGGYRGSGKSLWLTGEKPGPIDPEMVKRARMDYWPHFAYGEPPAKAELDKWWARFCEAMERLVPVAEECETRIAIHPTDIPLPDTLFGTLGYHRIIDAFPSRNVGYHYCCGTRAEAGGLPLVLEEIHNYGRKGRIFFVHFRNVRGSLPTARAYEEVHLDDGDMNMFKILLELKKVGYDGCINPDHIFPLEGDPPEAQTANFHCHQGLAYSVGYMKGLLAALATV